MSIITTSMALNIAVGIAVWLSDMSLAATIVITLLLTGMCALAFYAVWLSDSERVRKNGTGICIVFDAALMIIGFVNRVFFYRNNRRHADYVNCMLFCCCF